MRHRDVNFHLSEATIHTIARLHPICINPLQLKSRIQSPMTIKGLHLRPSSIQAIPQGICINHPNPNPNPLKSLPHTTLLHRYHPVKTILSIQVQSEDPLLQLPINKLRRLQIIIAMIIDQTIILIMGVIIIKDLPLQEFQTIKLRLQVEQE